MPSTPCSSLAPLLSLVPPIAFMDQLSIFMCSLVPPSSSSRRVYWLLVYFRRPGHGASKTQFRAIRAMHLAKSRPAPRTLVSLQRTSSLRPQASSARSSGSPMPTFIFPLGIVNFLASHDLRHAKFSSLCNLRRKPVALDLLRLRS